MEYFDRLNRCIAGWRQANHRILGIAKATETTQEWFADTLGFLEELLMVRGILDLDTSAHELDKDAERRAIEEAQKILDVIKPKEESDESERQSN